MAKYWECKYCNNSFPPRNFGGDMVCSKCGAEWEDGTYIYHLTRVKEAFNVGTMTMDDFVEIYEEIKVLLEQLQLERDAAIEGFKRQFELAKEVIKQNDELREKNKELDNALLKTHQKATERIIELEKDIQFFKNRQEINKVITQELIELNDPRIIDILTTTRIVK